MYSERILDCGMFTYYFLEVMYIIVRRNLIDFIVK